MFAYKGFEIERDDDANLSLYRKEMVDEFVGGGRGMGRGTATGNKVEKRVHKGFYRSFQAAFQRVADILVSETENVQDALQVLNELSKVGKQEV
jgi:hypothetical protein